MLEDSKTDIMEASVAERQIAEVMAHAYLATELEQNLVPNAKAHQTVADHRETGSETWRRAVHGMLVGLRAAEQRGYRLTQRASTQV